MKFNRCLLLSLLLFVVLLPAFINAEQECEYDGGCYGNGDPFGYHLSASKKHKTCDACYAFQCLDKHNRVMKGQGCYDDFKNACKWISSDVKLSAKGKKDLEISGENYVVVSCTGIPGCASLKLNQYLLTNGKQFGTKHGKMEGKTCEYDDTPKNKTVKPTCVKYGECVAGGNNATYANMTTTTCDGGCLFFVCIEDGKKNMIGSGCFEDFEKICTNVPADAKKKIKDNADDYFYYDSKAASIVLTCTNSIECVTYDLQEYSDNAKTLEDEIKDDKTYKEQCTFEPVSPFVTTTTSSNGPNNFEFSGMLLFGLSLFQLLFW